MPSISQEEKIYIVDYLKDTQEKLIDICKNISEDQATFKPSESIWSVANNVEHLALVENSLRKAVDFSLTQTPSEEEIAAHTASNNFVKKALNTRGTPVKAPERVAPTLTADIADSLALFVERRQENIAFVNETDADLHAHYWRHPAFGLLDAYQVFIMLAAHVERHIAQIEEVCADENFPKSQN